MIDLDRLLRETFVARAELHAELGSTNDRAQQAAAEGGPLPLLVLAERQTAGRGRGGNRWWTGRGSLAFSLLLPPLPDTMAGSPRWRGKRPGETKPSSQAPSQQPATSLVGLAAAVAVVEAAGGRLPDVPLGIHWPNDVFAAGRKLAGVLVEVLPGGHVVVGIGMNCNDSAADAPAELRDRIATLCDLAGREHPLGEVLIDVLAAFKRLLDTLLSDPAAVAGQADARCLQRDEWLRVESGSQVVEGRCLGIAPDGALELQTREGRKTLYSGVVIA